MNSVFLNKFIDISHELYCCNSPLINTAITLVSIHASPVSYQPLTRMHGNRAAKRPRSPPSHPAAAALNSGNSRSSSGTRAPGAPPSGSRARTHINPNLTSRGKTRVMEEMREQQYRDSLCKMCSDSSSSKYHHHFSSTSIRRMLMDTGSESELARTYMCPICQKLEPCAISPTETRRIVLADSTLYGIWGKEMPANTCHFDIDSVVGGQMRDMTRALIKNYLHLPNRLEIIVVAGINNIGRGHSPDNVMEDVEELRQVVKEHSEKWGHSPPSYVAVCTLPLAPKYCSLHVPHNPPEPEIAMWVPAPWFDNKYDKLAKVNKMLLDLHEKEGLKIVRLDFHGVKIFKNGKVQHKFDTKPGATQIWREEEVWRKLHFTMENKLKLVQYISTCFENNAVKP